MISPETIKEQQRAGAGRFDDLAEGDDDPPVEAVGDRAGDQDQEQRRRELDQPDQAEIEGVAGQIVDLPADRDADDLGGEGRAEARRPEERKAAMAKGAPGGLGR